MNLGSEKILAIVSLRPCSQKDRENLKKVPRTHLPRLFSQIVLENVSPGATERNTEIGVQGPVNDGGCGPIKICCLGIQVTVACKFQPEINIKIPLVLEMVLYLGHSSRRLLS